MNWIYQGKPVETLPEEVVGFVYIIWYESGQKYIGKKLVRSERRKKPLVGMRSNAKRMVMTEHKWQDYVGSSKEIPSDEIIKTKVITHLCTNKTSMTYLEAKIMMEQNVLVDDTFYNKNILGKFWDNCEDGVYYGQVGNQTIMEF